MVATTISFVCCFHFFLFTTCTMLLNLFDDLKVFLLDVLAAPFWEHPSPNQPFQCLTFRGKGFVFIYLIYCVYRCCPFPTTLFSHSSSSTGAHRAKGFLQSLLLLCSPTLHPCGLTLAFGSEGMFHEMIHIFSSPHCL